MKRIHRTGLFCALLALSFLVAGSPALALVEPDRSGIAEKEVLHPDLAIRTELRAPAALPGIAATQGAQDLAALGVPPTAGRLDVRGGRWATLLPKRPIVPGTGSGNELTWNGLQQAAPADAAALGELARQAVRGFVQSHAAWLRIDVAELGDGGRATVTADGALIQIYEPREFGGIAVRDNYLTAVINHGNLVLMGAHRWGDISVSTEPTIAKAEARATVAAHVDPHAVSAWRKSELAIVPAMKGKDLDEVSTGDGYDYRLVHVLRPSFANDAVANWEALVDAHSGELLSFRDTNHYATTRKVEGGVYPTSNNGVAPGGVEQAGWPMPFADVGSSGGTLTADAGGNLPVCLDGEIETALTGPFVAISDNCGTIDATSMGDIDLGTSGGTDCVTPGSGGAGNTHSSRTGFYELNRMIEMARGQLPGNAWLGRQLPANVNIQQLCNAVWNGVAVNFYRSGGGCANTGELAAVHDHEWGHGLDDNDALPFISSPGEGIADIYAFLRLDDSCIGPGFLLGTPCNGFGDPCTVCDGVRDVDWAQRASGVPHDVTWIDANCGSGGSTPCGGSTHCEGAVYAEAVWDLLKRDLPTLYGTDSSTAHEIVTRLTFLGAGSVGNWFDCVTPYGGCAAEGGYLNYLAADDDNGDLGDGTPHMQAIFDAFDRHGIACDSPTVQDAGCAGAPAAAPVVAATPLDRGASLSWGAVAGATGYQVFRTDGGSACDFGKAKVAETTGTSFLDGGLQNGRPYSYVVVPIGPAPACIGPSSACATVTPAAGANLGVDPGSGRFTMLSGDGDEFVDNCETWRFEFDASNVGAGTLTNVKIASVSVPGHPGVVIDTILPALGTPASIVDCEASTLGFEFTAAGLTHDDTLVFEVAVTSDELTPQVRTGTFSVRHTESNLFPLATKTWDFETDREGWHVLRGTFDQTTAGGGASGSAGYLASSANLDEQCDQVRSPAFKPTPTTTLTLWNQFDIEPAEFGVTWYDRANVGIVENGKRTAVEPDSGRQYNASGPYGVCATAGQNGWADAATSWASSSWSAAALGSAGRAGKLVELDVAYGTDPAVHGTGFWFDRVTVTNAAHVVPDGLSDVCGDPGLAASPGSVPAGTPVQATFSNIAPPTRLDWIGLYAPAAPATGFKAWVYANSCSHTAPTVGAANGMCPLPVPGNLPPGSYELRLYANNSYNVVVTSAPFQVTGSGGTTLQVAPGTAFPGEIVQVDWSGLPAPTGRDWIGVLAPGSPGSAFLDWFYTSCTKTPNGAVSAGGCAYSVPASLPPGDVEFRLFENDGFNLLATSNPLTVHPTGSPPTLAAAASTVVVGAPVNVAWDHVPTPTGADWIGLAPAGSLNSALTAWIYTSCTQTSGPAKAVGSCSFPIPAGAAPGTYEFRLFSNNGYTRIATSDPVQVLPLNGVPSVSVPPASVCPGDTITVEWNNVSAATPKDWFGIYAAGTPNAAFQAWWYTSCTMISGPAKPAGTCEVEVPDTLPNGSYEIRLLANNGFGLIAKSGPFGVGQFTFTESPGAAIPDNSVSGLTRTIDVLEDVLIADLDVELDINHTWVGDLTVSLTHPDGTTVNLVDRPGVPESAFGCSEDNYSGIVLDDEGTGGAFDALCTSNATSPPNYTPFEPLSGFDGKSTAGMWTLFVQDLVNSDEGTLNEWSLKVDAVCTPNP